FAAVILDLMSEVTRILSAIEQGDPHAAEELLPLVYDELRRLAAPRLADEGPGHTLQPTALGHEAYLKLVGPRPQPPSSGCRPLAPAGAGAPPRHPQRPPPPQAPCPPRRRDEARRDGGPGQR